MIETEFVENKCFTCTCFGCRTKDRCSVYTENQGRMSMCEYCSCENYAGLDECPFDSFKKINENTHIVNNIIDNVKEKINGID